MKPQDQDRRGWLAALVGTGIAGSVASFVYPVLKFIFPPTVAESAANEVVAAKISDLPVNSGKIFKFGSRPGLVVHTQSGDWLAFTAVCTHLNCTVQYKSDTQKIWCACHNGMYDLNGNVISGPPPKPLEAYETHIRNGEVVVSKKS
jgi:Rieske Fe-S protein